jgi:hypothetical protein
MFGLEADQLSVGGHGWPAGYAPRVWWLWVGCCGCVGVWSATQTPPSSALAWVAVVVGLSLGALVGTYFIGALAQVLLHALVPSYVSRNGSMVRVRVWHTWHGLWQGFRRTDVLVHRAQLRGVEFMVGQGGETQVFVVHVSGQSFGTGWRGSRKSAVSLGEELLAWIETAV